MRSYTTISFRMTCTIPWIVGVNPMANIVQWDTLAQIDYDFVRFDMLLLATRQEIRTMVNRPGCLDFMVEIIDDCT